MPASASANGDADLFDQLSDIDPQFGKDVQALLAFIEKSDPEAAARFRRVLRAGVDARASAANAPAAAAGAQGGSRSQSIEVALRASVTDLQVQIGDGTQITAHIVDVTVSARFSQALGQSDPLVLDLNGNGAFDTTTAQGGNYFDLAASGRRARAATAAGGDGLLVLDRNNNGRIDDGSELFGDQNGRADGFAELGSYDQNRDGWVDAADPVFQKLGVWQDANLNGQTDDGEVRSLTDAHVARIALAAQSAAEVSSGNAVVKAGAFVRDDGSQGRVGDLLLNYVV
ncbi:MAG: hypothetical protein J0I06_27225 [Planctomycetes bacterium]|nr:hypothetical protein [Planctomycetota bacterium]